MSSDEGTHISMAAHEIVGAIERFCELAKDDPKRAMGEYDYLILANNKLYDALDEASEALLAKADDVHR